MGIKYMKQINTYINEKLRLTAKRTYTCHPKDKHELRDIIMQRIKDEGPVCDLNDIDTSKITDMSLLFDASFNKIFEDFNGNISMWDVSNVKYMSKMFYKCYKFNCDLSMWDVSNVKDMEKMFWACESFDCNISKWDVSNVENMLEMFMYCAKFNGNISSWDVSNVTVMYRMFYDCEKFNQNLNSWDVSNVKNIGYAFWNCPTQPIWYDKDKYK